MFTTPRFLQGIVPFEGRGLDAPFSLGAQFSYVVPAGITAQPLYFRGGNSTDELVCAILQRDGTPMRYFPIGARASVHVPLRVIQDLTPETHVELHLAAPAGLVGTLVADVGIVEL
ncbi:molybdopterin oxidoreductase [Frankia sp. AgB32]|uniref:molybdopterin oxidoreductase n=1 Tax=Frankia sp. AgB32 TaxID=631119 RepID=UPI00200E81DB|nr:molybdopterin oxidoreductase [Frankia sp. AgB32]MCK9893260.1 molybdopterin oxidoreductase [Frankia sp. AgB32]